MTINLKRLPVALASSAADRLARAKDVVAQKLERVARPAQEASVDLARRARDETKVVAHDVKLAATSAFEAGKREVRKELAPLDPHEQVQQLQPGDTWKLAASSEASVEGVAGSAANAVTVTRSPAGGYVVAASGELGVGLTTGKTEFGEGGKGASSVMSGAGAKVECTFATAAEAERAANLLNQARFVPPSRDDLSFLRSHVSALEFKGAAAGELSAKFTRDVGVAEVGASASAGVRTDRSVRVEFSGGSPSSVVLRSQLTGTVGAKASVGANAPTGIGGELELGAQVEQRFALPRGLDASKVLADPVAALGAAARGAQATEKVSVTLSSTASTSSTSFRPDGTTSESVRAQVRFDASGRDTQAAMSRYFMTGDFRSSLAHVGAATTVSASLVTSRSTGLSVKGAGGVGAELGVEVGLKGGLDATRTHSETLWRYPAPGASPASLTDVCDKLATLPAARRAVSTIRG